MIITQALLFKCVFFLLSFQTIVCKVSIGEVADGSHWKWSYDRLLTWGCSKTRVSMDKVSIETQKLNQKPNTCNISHSELTIFAARSIKHKTDIWLYYLDFTMVHCLLGHLSVHSNLHVHSSGFLIKLQIHPVKVLPTFKPFRRKKTSMSRRAVKPNSDSNLNIRGISRIQN